MGQVHEQDMVPRKITLNKHLAEFWRKAAAQAGRSDLAQDLRASTDAEDAGRNIAMVKA